MDLSPCVYIFFTAQKEHYCNWTYLIGIFVRTSNIFKPSTSYSAIWKQCQSPHSQLREAVMASILEIKGKIILWKKWSALAQLLFLVLENLSQNLKTEVHQNKYCIKPITYKCILRTDWIWNVGETGSCTCYSLPSKQLVAAERLASVVDVTNETVGDALSDLLLVETILQSRGWDTRDWLLTYTDLPNRLAKVSVKV